MAMMDDLPDELVLAVALLLCGRSAYRLGMTCRRMNRVMSDPRLWRQFFVRDYSCFYKDICKGSHPPTCHPTESWPPEARLLCDRTGAAAAMPQCEPDPDLPPPFSHAFSSGKDWQWMYRAHATPVPSGSHHTGPGMNRRRYLSTYVGDWVDGLWAGYGVTIDCDGRTWDQAQRRSPGQKAWSVSCNGNFLECETDGFRSLTWHDGGQQEWYAWGERAIGNTDEWRGAFGVNVTVNADGRLVEPVRDGAPHGVVRTYFANGDVQAIRYARGCLIKGVEFTCSPTCPVSAYAGRTLRCQWETPFMQLGQRRGRLLVAAVKCDPLDWSNGPPDEALFWHYVVYGLVGWDDDARRRVLAKAGFCFWPKTVALKEGGYA